MSVLLKAVGNPDHNQFHGEGVLAPTATKKVRGFQEASEICRNYISTYDLGSGNWAGGILKRGREVVGHVAFNGSVWPGLPDDWQPGDKPLWRHKESEVLV